VLLVLLSMFFIKRSTGRIAFVKALKRITVFVFVHYSETAPRWKPSEVT